MEDAAVGLAAAPGSARDVYLALSARLSRILGACELETLDAAVEECLEQVGRHAAADLAFLILSDEDERISEDWRWVAGNRPLVAPEINSPVRDTFGSVTEILRLGHTIAVDDLAQIDLAPSERALADANGLRAILVAPVRVGSTLLGITGLQVLDQPRHWDQELIEQVDFFAELMVKAVVRTRHHGALAAADARARRIAEFLPDGLLLVNLAGAITFVSPSFARAVGVDAADIVGVPFAELVSAEDVALVTSTMATDRLAGSGLVVRMHAGNDWRWFALSWQLVHEPDSGVADETVITLRDVHEQHLEAIDLTRRQEQDPLTGLLDRRGLDSMLTEMAQAQKTIVMAFIDVDRFKVVNDTFGHAVGDEVLIAIAAALTLAARRGDVASRIGGDEFCVVAVVDDDRHEVPAVLGQRLLDGVTAGLAELGPPVTVSIGVGRPGPAADAPLLRDAADRAMYHAKRSGGGQFAIAAAPAPPPP